MKFPEGGVREQTRQSLLNVKAVLEQSGASLDTVLKTTCFLAKMEDFAVFNEVYTEFLATQERQHVHAFRPANYQKKP